MPLDAGGRRYRLRADLPGVGYVLAPGDQIELRGEAKLLLEPD